RHRAEFGISVIRECWGLGIGRALTQACVACARRAGYAQLELDVVAENARAIALYRSEGFVEYGRNPKGFRTRDGRWQELVLMRLELN
ncbi:MAG: GNAT family N-acetyltransferase, partial [Atopobiaceae bacterium]|nr:GNAT family N-acetyltransferase [Atopobiaceae bacterium]